MGVEGEGAFPLASPLVVPCGAEGHQPSVEGEEEGADRPSGALVASGTGQA